MEGLIECLMQSYSKLGWKGIPIYLCMGLGHCSFEKVLA